MLRTILVALDDSPYTDTATRLAIDWGKRFKARLLGLGLLDTAAIGRGEAVPLGASSFKRERDSARIVDTHGRVQGFLSKFQERCSSEGVAVEVFEGVGNPAANILRAAHRCDVVMIGRETHFHLDAQKHEATVAQVLRESPRPVVIVPPKLPAGEGVLLAYGGGREVAHTLQTFHLLGLTQGETVHVLSVHREGWHAGELARLACDFLDAHGVTVEMHEVVSKSAPAEVLLDQVQRIQPRMLVMGAHGQHALKDLFLSSVTHDVLSTCPVPVFLGA
jgi:nucleotide-binding universal stress UspA family protein